MSLQITFVAIVKNEAHNLPRCLGSVFPFVDELIVVDTGSDDNSVEVAQQHGATVHYFEWCDDFAAARNYACSLVSGDWILTLDADEELVAEENWMMQLRTVSDTVLAFAIQLRDAQSDETQMRTLRLFRSGHDIVYRDRYHEHLFYEGQPLTSDHSAVDVLTDVMILHYGYADHLLVSKSLRRIPILEHIRVTEGLSLMLLWTLSGMYKATAALAPVQTCYEEAWERLFPSLMTGDCPTDTRSVRSWLYALAVRSLQADDIETSLFICEQGIEWFPDFPPLFYLKGLILKITDALSDSIYYFEHCLEVGKTGHYSTTEPFDQALITVYPAFDLGTVYLALNQLQSAIAAFELTLTFDPNHAEAQRKRNEAQDRLDR